MNVHFSDSTTRSFHSSVLRRARLFNSQWLSWVQLMTSLTRESLTFFYNWRCTVSKGSRLVPLCFSCIFTTAIKLANSFGLGVCIVGLLQLLHLIFSHLYLLKVREVYILSRWYRCILQTWALVIRSLSLSSTWSPYGARISLCRVGSMCCAEIVLSHVAILALSQLC